ncbi:MAG: LpxI family protein [Candidatus Methylomirabilia bacterium]
MGRTLGLMAGAGVLPGRVAAEAAQRGWRVVAFTFGEARGLDGPTDRVVPSRLTDVGNVLERLQSERVAAIVFAGLLPKSSLLDHTSADPSAHELLSAAGGLSDTALGSAVLRTLAGLGIEVLDPRTFLSSLLVPSGTLTARVPSEAEWTDVRLGLRLARQCAAFGIGQTVVVRRGLTVAVEAIEGTSETIRRGCRLAGPGAVVVKGVAPEHDYRFDVPTVGLETLEAMVGGKASAVGLEAGKVLLLDREAVVTLADQEGIAIVSVDSDSG